MDTTSFDMMYHIKDIFITWLREKTYKTDQLLKSQGKEKYVGLRMKSEI